MNSKESKYASSSPADAGDDSDFEEMLSRIGYGHLYRSLPRRFDEEPRAAGPAPAQPPVDAAPGGGALARHASAITAVLGVAAVCVLLTLASWGYLHRLMARTSQASWPAPFVEAPFFSMEGFHSIQAGMTEAEARDLLGPPLLRRARGGNQADWLYTVPEEDVSDEPAPVCQVTFEDGRIVRARQLSVRGRLGFGISPVPEPKQEVGRVWALTADGRKEALEPAGKRPRLLISDAVPEDWQVPAGLEAAACRVSSCGTSRIAVGLELAPVSVYWRGWLYNLPLWERTEAEAVARDAEWILGRLGA